MDHEQPHSPVTTRTDAVIDTGAALASAAGFGLFGAVVGRAIGGLGNSHRHNLSGLIGAWLGGVTFSVLSLYASFRGRESYERTIDQLKQENLRLRIAAGEAPVAPNAQAVGFEPQQLVNGVSHEGHAAQPEHSRSV